MKSKGKGFTLLELIMVMFLITLILGMSAFFLAGGALPSAKLDAAGREISGLIRHARSLSKLNSERTTFTIDLDGRSYGIEGQAPKALPPDLQVRIADPVSGEITQGKYSIVFNPAGGMNGGSIILSGKKKSLRIDLDPITGATMIK